VKSQVGFHVIVVQEYLKSAGNVKEIYDINNVHPFYKGAELYLISSNSKVQQSAVIKNINGTFVKLTLHLLDKRGSR
jgi:hypothetical protein